MPGWARRSRAAGAINRLDPEIAKWLAGPSLQPIPEGATSEFRAWHAASRPKALETLDKLRASRQLLAACADEAALIARMEETHRDFAAWRDGANLRVDALRARIDTAITAEDWDALRAVLQADRQPYWFPLHGSKGLMPELIDQSLVDYARDGLRAAQVQLATDYYVSRELRPLVPDALIAFMEPYWRGLDSNRPHRMGGIHDAVQSDPQEGPTSQVLLFQITTDYAMHWVFGDCGAYYVFIDTGRLAANDFSELETGFENY
jgi:hypothetical protein